METRMFSLIMSIRKMVSALARFVRSLESRIIGQAVFARKVAHCETIAQHDGPAQSVLNQSAEISVQRK